MDPLYSVATQLNTLIALGMETRNVSREKTNIPVLLIPTVNMWCAQTSEPKKAIARLEKAMDL